ncbi:MAG: hypothetical protein ACTSR8_18125 [Promethearchaeota archaeon]
MTEINLKVNDQEIPLNPIMTTMLRNLIVGFIDALKDIPEDKKKIIVDINL